MIYSKIKFVFQLVSLLIFFSMSNVLAQGTQGKEPKIGLVLSGGGAKGMAHVGVLRYMEKAGIRPDYIVGTSMGSVIGGMYALGYSADELEAIIRSSDWELIVSNRVGFNDISFEEKEYYNRYIVELPVVGTKVGFPSGLIEGQKLSETLHYYTWPANEIKNFDSLPIPFRCVATDVRNGEGIVIKSGSLQDALRASLAIPTFFTPFDMDSTLAVDGGVVNNFPVDVVREMGADIVIGVNVSDEDFIDPKELGSFAAILMQIAMSKSYSKLIDNIKNTDIYIKPDLKNNSTGSFGKYDEILRLGDAAGQQYYERFKALADSLGINRPTLGIGLEVEPIHVSKIEVSGNKLFSDLLITSKLGIEEGDIVTRNQVRDGISRVFGINGFYKVDYSLIKQEDDSHILQIRTREKPKNVLFASFHYDNEFSVGLVLNLTMRDLIGKSSRTVVVGDISENPKLRLDYYKYFGMKKKYALFLRYEYLNQEIPVFENGRSVDQNINRERRILANIMSTQSLKETFVIGLMNENEKSSSRFNVRTPEDVKNAARNFWGVRFMYYRNSLNDRNYATRGAESIVEPMFQFGNKFSLNLNEGVDTLFLDTEIGTLPIPAELIPTLISSLTPGPYMTFYFKYLKYFPLSRKFQVVPTLATGLTVSGESGNKVFSNFSAGGHQRIRFNDTRVWGLNYREFNAANVGKIGAELQYVALPTVYLRTGFNLASFSDHVPLEQWGTAFFDQLGDNALFGYGADITLKTLLGPITGGISTNTVDKNVRFYLSVGYSFNFADR